MNIDHPTTRIHFVFAFTFCVVTVYETEAKAMRKFLEVSGMELCDESENKTFQEVDTRLLADIMLKGMPKYFQHVTNRISDEIAEIEE